MKAGSCVPPDGQRSYQHMSRLMEGHLDCGTMQRCASQPGRSRCSTGCQHKGSRGHANSTQSKDLGAVVHSTAARVHNSDTFALLVRVKQSGPQEFSQQLAGSPLRAATADVRTVTSFEATGGLSHFGELVLVAGSIWRRRVLKLASVSLGFLQANCQRPGAHVLCRASGGHITWSPRCC